MWPCYRLYAFKLFLLRYPRAGFANIILVGLFALNGCASMTDSTLTKLQGTGLGCLTGGAMGNLLRNDTKGFITGCIAGSVAGFAYGEHVAGKKSEFASQEAYLEAVIAESERVTQETRLFNQEMSKEINDLKTKNRTFKARLASAQKNIQELEALDQALANKIEHTQKQIALVENEIKIQNHVIAQQKENSPYQLVSAAENQLSRLSQEQILLKAAMEDLLSLKQERI